MRTNAQAASKGAIMLLTNFVFISVISFSLLFWAFSGSSLLGGHFWPFTDVLRENLAVRYAENAEKF
jgi:hypothetical protein